MLVDVTRRLLLQHRDADVGREDHRHHPGHQQRDGHHGKQGEAVFTGAALGESHWQKTRHRHQRAGEHRECGGGVGVGGGAKLVPALLHFLHHHLHSDHRVVDQQAERDDQRAQRYALQADVEHVHEHEGDREHQRNADRHDEAGAHPQTHEADDQHDADGLEQPARELPDGFLDHHGLVGDAMHVDAHRQVALDTRELLFERRAEIEHVAALRHRNANADRGRAVEAVLRRRRILVTARHAREIPKPHLPVTDDEWRRSRAPRRSRARHSRARRCVRPAFRWCRRQ